MGVASCLAVHVEAPFSLYGNLPVFQSNRVRYCVPSYHKQNFLNPGIRGLRVKTLREFWDKPTFRTCKKEQVSIKLQVYIWKP